MAWRDFVGRFISRLGPRLFRSVAFVSPAGTVGDPWSRTAEQVAKDEQAMRDAMAISSAAIARELVRLDSLESLISRQEAAECGDESAGLEAYKTAAGRWKWRIRIDDVVTRVSPVSYSRKWTALRGFRRASINRRAA